jgi:hypothetical protein
MNSAIWKGVLALNLVLAAAVVALVGTVAMTHRAQAADNWGYDGQPFPVGGTVQTMVIPGQVWEEVTPSNTTDLASTPRAIYSVDGGTVQCRDRNGNVMPLILAAGEMKPLRCARVMSTNTTATEIWAVY